MTDKTFYSPTTGKPLHKVPDGATIPADMPHGFEASRGGFTWVAAPVSAYPFEGRVGGYNYWTEEPIAPPMPPLPTEPGSLIRATDHDGTTCEVAALSVSGVWYGVDQEAEFCPWMPKHIASWEPVRVLPNGVGAMDETDKRVVLDVDGCELWWSEGRGVWMSPVSTSKDSKADIARTLGPLSLAEGADQ